MAESLRKKKLDTQLLELAGRNWLASELMRAGIEVARPERDRGIDLIAYVDLDDRVGDFTACPIQMKAATDQVFSLDPKYAKFPGLILAYVWNLADSSKTKCFALTYEEALAVAQKMEWTETAIMAPRRKQGHTRVLYNQTLKAALRLARSVRNRLKEVVAEGE